MLYYACPIAGMCWTLEMLENMVLWTSCKERMCRKAHMGKTNHTWPNFSYAYHTRIIRVLVLYAYDVCCYYAWGGPALYRMFCKALLHVAASRVVILLYFYTFTGVQFFLVLSVLVALPPLW